MLFNEVPFLERFECAARAGFKAVEFLFPYEYGIADVRAKALAAGLEIALFDVPPGNRDDNEFGTLCLPHRKEFFKSSFVRALEALEVLECSRLNVLFGNRNTDLTVEEQKACAMENLLWAVPRAADAGVTLLLEPLSPATAPNCLLRKTDDAVDIIREIGSPMLRLQYDIFHAQLNEGNLVDAIDRHRDYIGHFQIADAPGRHEPGTGEIDFHKVLAKIRDIGYGNFIGLEYSPLKSTQDSLDCLSTFGELFSY